MSKTLISILFWSLLHLSTDLDYDSERHIKARESAIIYSLIHKEILVLHWNLSSSIIQNQRLRVFLVFVFLISTYRW